MRYVATQENKLILLILSYSLFVFVYLLTNKIQLFEPEYLPMTWIDQKIPFIPETVWVYMSDYIYLVSITFFLKDTKTLNKLLWSFYIILAIQLLFFVFYPTIYPRPDLIINGFSTEVFHLLRQLDNPTNCFPSSHVSLVTLGPLFMYRVNRRYFYSYFLWALCIYLSTLTTKQHYVVDVISGIILAVLCFSYVDYKFNKKDD